MEIEMDRVAYHFQSLSVLKTFIKIYNGKIMRGPDMIRLYKDYKHISFHFHKGADGIDWLFDYTKTYVRWGYRIIKYGQRTEGSGAKYYDRT